MFDVFQFQVQLSFHLNRGVFLDSFVLSCVMGLVSNLDIRNRIPKLFRRGPGPSGHSETVEDF